MPFLQKVKNLVSLYSAFPRAFFRLVFIDFLHEVLYSSFFLIFNLFLKERGYSDTEIALYQAYRYGGVLIVSLPVAFLLRRSNLKRFLIAGSLLFTLFSFVLLFVFERNGGGKGIILTLWGASWPMFRVTVLPYVLYLVPSHRWTYAFGFQYSMQALGSMSAGILFALISHLYVENTTFSTLITMTSLGVFAFFLTFSMPSVKSRFHHRPWWDYNWKRVVLAELPVLLIAIGAGITIPFMNLFFHEQFQIPPATFSLIGGGAGFLVLLGNLLIPKVHSKWGYKKTLLWTQGSGIVLLILLGFTDLYAHTGNLALQLSILFYLLRQPLMNIATPITNDLIVKVVGEKNQELVSGFNSLIWSGSWVFGSFFFGFLRSLHFPYRTVFWLTSVLYLLGLTAYLFLIQRLEKEISSSSK